MRVSLPRFSVSRLGRPHARIRVRNPIVEGKLYVYHQPQWDVYSTVVAAALLVQRLFQVQIGGNYTPVGGAAQVKSIYHTSMGINGGGAGSFPDPEKFFVMGIGLSVRSDIAIQDAHRFLYDSILDLQIGGRSFAMQHAFRFGSAGGAFGSTAGIISNGLPVSNPENEFRTFGDQGETIEQRQGFFVQIDPTRVIDGAAAGVYTTAAAAAGGAGINAFVFLDGLIYREIL